MLKLPKKAISISNSGSKASSDKAAKYYKEEEKHLDFDGDEKSTGDDKNYSDYIKGDNLVEKAMGDKSKIQLSEWGGALAEKANIDGKEVTKEELSKAFEGKFLGQEIQRRTDGTRRAGHDLVFSAPKSASVMAVLFKDERLIKAHIDAVKTTMKEFAKTVPFMRITNPITKEVERVQSDQILYALETHKTSRKLDPQMHTHALLINMILNGDGNLRALNIDTLYEKKLNLFYGKMYQASFNKSVRSLGYETHSVGNGQFEISGIPKSFLDSFSQRRGDIVKLVKEMGATNVNTIDDISTYSRDPKSNVASTYLNKLWQDRKSAFNGEELLKAALNRSVVNDKEAIKPNDKDVIKPNDKDVIKPREDYITLGKEYNIKADKVIDLTISHISRFQTKMDYNLILSKAIEDFAIEQGVDIVDLKSSLEQKIANNEVIGLDKHSTVLTTQKQQKDELSIHSRLKNQVKNMKTVVNSSAIEKQILTKDNAIAVQKIFESTKQANLVNVEGNHKSLINALIDFSNDSNKTLKIISPNHYHVKDIKEATVANLSSKDKDTDKSSRIINWIKKVINTKEDSRRNIDTLGGFLYKQENSANKNIASNDIIVIDQAEKLSVKDTQKILDITQSSKSKVVFLNHKDASFNSKNAGNVIETLNTGGINNIDFKRQKQSQTELHINEVLKDEDRIKTIVSDYGKLTNSERDNVMLVSSSKKDVGLLNKEIRNTLIDKSELGSESFNLNMNRRVYLTPEQKLSAKFFKQGERIDFFTKDKGVISYQINDVDTKSNLVSTTKIEDDKITLKSVFSRLLKDNKPAVEKTSFNPLDNKNDFTLVKKEKMEIRKGDKIFVFNSIVKELEKGQGYTIHSLDKENISLVDRHGEVTTVTHKQFEISNIDYDYNRTLDYVSYNESKPIIANLKQYKLNKEVTAELLNKATGDVKLYTDDSKKAENKIKLSGVQPSSIYTTLQSQSGDSKLEKYINDDTRTILEKDLSVALNAINTEFKKDDITKAVEHVIDVLTDRQAAFSHEELLEKAVEYSMSEFRGAIDFQDVQEKIDELKQQGKILSDSLQTTWTTKEAVEIEKSILKSADSGKGQVKQLATDQETKNYLHNVKQAKGLTKGQQDAVKLITNTQDRFVAIQGYAGTGKSTMLQQAQTLVQHSKSLATDKNIEFVGLAPTHQAVEVLNSKNIGSQTAKSLLFEETQNILSSKDNDMSNKVFLLDESSMMSNKDFSDFMKIVDQKNARAIFLGDIKQLESLESGAPFKMLILSDKIDVAVMKEILRQVDNDYLKGVTSLAKSRPELAYKFLDQQQGHTNIEYKDKRPSVAVNIVEPEFDKKEQAKIKELESKNDEASDKAIKAMKIEKMLSMTANEYLARTPKSRENSMIIANSHNERNYMTDIIRNGLMEENSIGSSKSNVIEIDRLVNLDRSNNEMRTIDAYKGVDVIQKGQNKYYHITNVDTDNNLLEIKDVKTGKTSFFSPSRSNHRFNGAYEIKSSDLALNDKVIVKKTNKLKNMQANEKLIVTGINTETGDVTMTSKGGKEVTINKSNVDDLHWEHGYTTTTHGFQGDDRTLTITVNKSNSPLADPKSDYVKQSRGTHHVMCFTDDKEDYINKIKQEYEGNTVALKVTGDVSLTEYFDRYAKEQQQNKKIISEPEKVESKQQLETNVNQKTAFKTDNKVKSKSTKIAVGKPKTKSKFSDTIISEKVYDPQYLDSKGNFDIKKYGAEVAKQLTMYTEDIARQTLGEENKSISDSKYLSYGSKSGSLKVTLTGRYRGHWRDWESGERGDLISLIMRENNYTYSQAVLEGAKMVSMPDAFSIKETKNHEALKTDILESAKKIKSYNRAARIWQYSRNIKGTLAQKYLTEHRGVSLCGDTDIKFNANVYTEESKQKYQPALVARFTDEKGKMTGIETIYLERGTGKKVSGYKVPKRSSGTKHGSAVQIQSSKYTSSNTTLVVEGVVTGMSVANALKDEHVIAVGGKSNMSNLSKDMTKDNIIICADNDNIDLSKDKGIIKATETLAAQGKNVHVIMPEMLRNYDKTDYNDIHNSQGLNAVIENIKPVLDTIKSQETSIDKIVNKLLADNKISKEDVKEAISYVRNTGDIDSKSIEKHITDTHNNIDGIDINNVSKSVVDNALKLSEQSNSSINTKVNDDMEIVKHTDNSHKDIAQRTK